MKRTFVTLLVTALLGLMSVRAQNVIDDIDDDTRDELIEEQDYELDSIDNSQITVNPTVKIKSSNKQPCIYDMPYSISANYPNYHRLAGNTAVLIGGGITALVILDLLPENATNWNKKEETQTPMFERYYNHVMNGPHWDGDDAIFNYVLHPYAGAAYYMSARSQGFNMWYSALYGFAVSTLFWEYGIEAFMEIPSWQDLIITPLGGWLLGESFYLAKRYIVEHDYRLLGSKALGYVTAFLLDPVNEFLGYFRGNDAHGWQERHKIQLDSSLTLTPDGLGGQAPTLSMKLTF
ncbi:MAG: DUF3943 domain-containing protein [Clostridiales bacterium]|nr:DUF3943 domain-containing protein [Clostridiales bacterium]